MIGLEVPRLERGYISDLTVPWRGRPGLALAMRVCVERTADGAVGLAHLLKPVPDTHIASGCIPGSREPVLLVSCVCGADVLVTGDLEPCPGDCRRWFIAQDDAAWVLRLPEQDPDE
jgi:hypothetical protein